MSRDLRLPSKVQLALLVAVLAAPAAPRFTGDDDGRPEVRRAVEKSLPLIESTEHGWFASRSCISCHHHSLGLMTAAVARERGFVVDESRIAEVVARMLPTPDKVRESVLQGDAGINAQFGQPYKLLGLAAVGVAANDSTDARVLFVASRQQPDGAWLSGSHRPPLEDSEFTATAFALRALRLYAPPGLASAFERRAARARVWLESATPRTQEERAMRLFGLAWGGANAATLASARQAVQAEQRPDGGWAQLATRASDAYATGQALVALNQAGGLSVADPAYLRGVEFLLRTQHDDGSWLVETRRRAPGLEHFESGFPHGEHQFISCAGTCWATLALALTVKPGPSPTFVRVAPLERAAPRTNDDGVTPLMLAACYEDVAAVRALLEAGGAGADVDATSKHGLTALMCAVGDVEKTRMLLERGAKVDARSELGFTALLLAAGHADGLGALKLLLEHGAKVGVEAQDGTTAAIAAALGGDRDKLALLLAAGAVLDPKGPAELTALSAATMQGDVVTARWLLDHGAAVDSPALGENGTPLAWAVLDGRTEIVELLLARGAKVDPRDSDGLTPLMWAATVDYGDSAIVAALLAKGADVHARAPDGTTALMGAEREHLRGHVELLLAAGAKAE
ncbi:MAG: ankyrin repeat domain-containing protein [Planctomycetes bacterium]|nr:ankyrin repeat domain-containing protein [Planctomycetota bacterium]